MNTTRMKFSLKANKRSAVSPVIATLLLIAIAVAAAIIVYAFVTGLIGGLSSGGNSNLVTLTGTISVPSGSGTGVVTIQVRNTANSPISGICIQSVTPSVAGIAAGGGSGCTGANNLPFTYNGLSIQQSGSGNANVVPIGATAAGTASSTAAMQAGTGYTLSVEIYFSNGSVQIQNLDVTAQI